jgi:hypothetical protein
VCTSSSYDLSLFSLEASSICDAGGMKVLTTIGPKLVSLSKALRMKVF